MAVQRPDARIALLGKPAAPFSSFQDSQRKTAQTDLLGAQTEATETRTEVLGQQEQRVAAESQAAIEDKEAQAQRIKAFRNVESAVKETLPLLDAAIGGDLAAANSLQAILEVRKEKLLTDPDVQDTDDTDLAIQLVRAGKFDVLKEDYVTILQQGQELNRQELGLEDLSGQTTPAKTQVFENLVDAGNLTPSDAERAARISLGLDPRASLSAQERIALDAEMTRIVAESEGKIAEAREAGKQEAQLEFLPQKVKSQYEADFAVEAPKRLAANQEIIRSIDNVLEETSLATNEVGYFTAGTLGSALQFIAGTPAKDLSGKIRVIKANIGFERLQKMRENSPTGGALGQVAVQELEFLQASIATLDQGLSPLELKRAISKVVGHYENWRRIVNGKIDADEALRLIQNEKATSGFIGEDQKTARLGEGINAPGKGDFEEGQTATGLNGERIIVRNGQWVPL